MMYLKKIILAILTFFQPIFSDRLIRLCVIISVILILGMSLFILVNLTKLPPQVPLFYTHSWGKAQLALSVFLFLPPLVTLFFLVINLSLGAKFFQEQQLIARVAVGAVLICAILLSISIWQIIKLLSY
ncbi:hypothetical protein HY388_01290 [Candidatus Daviesbacteria bacterium]|nr:hypothetical protein [Candidatus Daviesbacteria bacterium]